MVSVLKLEAMATEETVAAGQNIVGCGGVRIIEQNNTLIKCMVTDTPRREVHIPVEGMPRCSCETYLSGHVCEHMIAAMRHCQDSGALTMIARQKAQAAGMMLFGALQSSLVEDGTVRMEVNITRQDDGKLRIGLRVGEERLYVVRSIVRMMDAIDHGEMVEFGKGFTYQPEWMRFGKTQNRILDILRALVAAQRDQMQMKPADLRQMVLPEPFALPILHELVNLPFRLIVGGETRVVRRVSVMPSPLHWRVNGSVRGVQITALLPKGFVPLTSDCAYVAIGDRVIETPWNQRGILRVLWQQQQDYRTQFEYSSRQVTRVFGELVPFLKMTGTLEMEGSLERQLLKLPLVAQVYLDRDGKQVVARTQFVYGDHTIDPFDETEKAGLPDAVPRGGKLLLRDGAAQRQVLDTLGESGFYVRKGRVYLTGQEAIYDFISGGVANLQTISEVYFSRDFRKMTPRRPNLSGSIRLNGNRLQLQFEQDGVPSEEILGILQALSKRRRYFRLKDGSFLDLTQMDEWHDMAETVFEAVQQEGAATVASGDLITLNAYRACYLTNLLDHSHLPVTMDENVHDAVKALLDPGEDVVAMPSGLSLRPYQQRGFQWLMALDRLHMGGILADDMGLGKTVQMISVLKASHEKGKTSLVVAPTSLTYNWLTELERFTPDLSVMVMGGSGPQRAAQIEHVRNAKDVDVLITSYPLIRRDIELMKDIQFRFVILDEAQHIKNAGSVGAVAVKQLKAETRFALTGTPMENSMGELWSIFDFVLPGYLNSYSQFLRRYQDGDRAEDLRRRIRPFLLRRLKKDVLTELPDKLETTMTAQMTPEQTKIYQAAMIRLRDRVNTVMEEKGLGRGRTQVLSAITQLRQICCHPSLVLGDYAGSSGKVELLLDVLPGAIETGHRILLFSQFTSMLKILRTSLTESGYECMYLDGDTPPATRVEMTEKFNAGQAQIFLISLKAGGTGLNLTGADMVIHYDPWWNPAAQDQATDRAHRIGQTRKVQVIRLVTHGSIEEQVVELGKRKKALFDQLITPGEQLVTALTEADIRALFA